MKEKKGLILLMRHGQIPQFSPRRFIGQQDLPLDEAGISQARVTGKELGALNIDRVFCSTLKRTFQTAALVRPDLEYSIRRFEGLKEISLGRWEGLTKDEVRTNFPDEYEKRGETMADYRTPEGESFRDVQKRAIAALEEITAMGGTSLVVAHGGVNRTILCHLLNMNLDDLFRLDQQYCGLNLISHTETGFTVHSVNWRPPALAFCD